MEIERIAVVMESIFKNALSEDQKTSRNAKLIGELQLGVVLYYDTLVKELSEKRKYRKNDSEELLFGDGDNFNINIDWEKTLDNLKDYLK